MLFVGIDWSEAHHDICLVDEEGEVLARRRIAEGVAGLTRLHAVVAEQAEDPADVVVGIELDRGLLVQALVATGYQVYAINPLAASRYRDRHAVSGAKSDPGDAKVLADLVRTDRHNHRPIAGDSALAEAIKVLARAHRDLIHTRQLNANRLRSQLREFYPAALAAFGANLAHPDAVAVLARAPHPEQGRRLSTRKLVSALRRGGRVRNLEARAARIRDALRAPQLQAPPRIARAYAATTAATVAVIEELNTQIAALERELAEAFEEHPDAEILQSLPGLGPVLGARVLAEFGDDRTRYRNTKARKAYAGTAPITRTSGTKRVVMARYARNKRLADACQRWAFSAISASQAARSYYDAQRAKGKGHHQALRSLANRLVGILHGCLTHRQNYRAETAWPAIQEVAA